MEAESLAREFASRAVPYSGGLLLFRPDDALQLINRAAEAGVPIDAIRGLRVEEGEMRSAPGDAADFSDAVVEGHGCWTDAEEFIRDRRDRGLVFELTLDHDDPLNGA